MHKPHASLVLLLFAATSCAADGPTTAPVAAPMAMPAQTAAPTPMAASTVAPVPAPTASVQSPTTAPVSPWPALSELLGRTGTDRDGVYVVTIPRTDLTVETPDAGEIPTAAGLESMFHFFMCPCGKTNVVGTFLVADYESNDVIDELRGAQIHVVSVAPALYNETPRLLAIRFQGEGPAAMIAGGIRAALDRTGEARSPKITLPK